MIFNFFNVMGKKNIKPQSPMQTEKSQPETLISTLSVYPRVRITLPPSVTDDRFYLTLRVSDISFSNFLQSVCSGISPLYFNANDSSLDNSRAFLIVYLAVRSE